MHGSGLDWSEVGFKWLSDDVISLVSGDWLDISLIPLACAISNVVLGLWLRTQSPPSGLSSVWLVPWPGCWFSTGGKDSWGFASWTSWTNSHGLLFDRKHSGFTLVETEYFCRSELLFFLWGLCIWLFPWCPLNTVRVEIWLMEWLSMTMMSLRDDCCDVLSLNSLCTFASPHCVFIGLADSLLWLLNLRLSAL